MIAVTIAAYVLGLLIFYVWGTFNTVWYEYYYLWDKGKDFFLFIVLYQVVNVKIKKAILPVVVFSSVRFLWQIVSSITKLDINMPKIGDYLFLILSSICAYLTLKELVKWHR